MLTSAGSRQTLASALVTTTPLDLHCSLRATNPGVPLIVLAVENELASDIIVDVQLFAAYKEVLSVEFLSAQPRCKKLVDEQMQGSLSVYPKVILLVSLSPNTKSNLAKPTSYSSPPKGGYDR
ncbi:hypothetical protein WJX77_000676 [Trebouxia sp. C0004]